MIIVSLTPRPRFPCQGFLFPAPSRIQPSKGFKPFEGSVFLLLKTPLKHNHINGYNYPIVKEILTKV